MKPDSVVALCSGGDIKIGMALSLITLFHERPRFDHAWIATISGPLMSVSRNRNVREFLKLNREYLLHIDSDVVFTPADVDKLYDCMENQGADVVNGVYAGSDGDVVIQGAGFMLARRRVFEGLKQAWFDYLPREDPPEGEEAQFGEDISFYMKAHEAGFKVLHDTDIRVGHLKTQQFVIDSLQEMAPAGKQAF